MHQKNKNNFDLSIIIPVFNELNFLEVFTKSLQESFRNYNVEYIFINDGSTDGSKEWLEEYLRKLPENQYKLISYDKNIGKGFALGEGLKIATGDYYLFQDSDLELDTNDSLDMYKIIKKDEEMHVLFGSRYSSGKLKKNKNLINELVGKFNTLLFNILFHQSINDLHCGSKIISKIVKDKINLKIKDFGFEIDLSTQIAKNNFQIYEYGISYLARSKAEGKKITWFDGIKSYFYLFKTRFIDNDFSILISIIYSSIYMAYMGSYFGMGIGKSIMIVLLFIIGCFIGLYRKMTSSSLIFLFCYIGSLFSKGNGRIYTIIIFFMIGIFLSKKIATIVNKNTSNKFVKFFI